MYFPDNVRECSSTANILAVMDSSGSIGTQGFKSGQTFITRFIASLDIGEDNVHLGLMQFSTYTRVVFEITSITREEALEKADAMTLIGGGTQTGLAVRVSWNTIFCERFKRYLRMLISCQQAPYLVDKYR